MSSEIGNNIRVTVFGQSHSEGIGVVIDGLPAGEHIHLDDVEKFLARRAPGQNSLTTPRKESDTPRILSGLVDSVTCGAPLCAVFENADTRSKDYEQHRFVPRPAHADFPAHVKFGGYNDIRGGGHFSARLTAPLCFAGGVCLQILARRGITVGAHILSVGNVQDESFDPVAVTPEDLLAPGARFPATICPEAGEKMLARVAEAAAVADSVGGVVECGVTGLPVGLGSPIFGGVENRLSAAVFGIPAVKGIAFGDGFAVAGMTGSVNNDAFYYDDGKVKTRTNHHGGILGGLTSGMPLLFRAAFKPTPSIARPQQSVDLDAKTDAPLAVRGRHDPCVVLRAVPCVEAVTAITMLDLMEEK